MVHVNGNLQFFLIFVSCCDGKLLFFYPEMTNGKPVKRAMATICMQAPANSDQQAQPSGLFGFSTF